MRPTPQGRPAFPMASKTKQFIGRLYLGRDETGRERHKWVGRFPTEKERDEAVMRARIEHEAQAAQTKLPAGERITVGQYADEYIERMESGALLTKSGRPFKHSSIGTARGQLRRFQADFGSRPIGSVERHEAVRWAEKHGRRQGALQSVGTLFSLAVDEEIISRNPFRGLMRKPEGRGAEAPPTDAEFKRLSKACDVHDEYGPRLRAMLAFCAFTGVRPGEAMALDWSDINLPARRVTISKRLVGRQQRRAEPPSRLREEHRPLALG